MQYYFTKLKLLSLKKIFELEQGKNTDTMHSPI